MTLWKQLRILFLAVTLGSVVLVLLKVIQTTTINKPKSEESRHEANTISFLQDDI
jgi:hypothetical protein